MAVVALWWPESKNACGGSGELSGRLASSTSSIGPSSSPDRRRRRRCACWTRSRGLSPALAASSRVDERRWRSGELGKVGAVRERRQREGEWTRGVLGRLWARLEGSGPSTASRRWRGGRRRAQAARWHSTEQLGCAGWKTTGGGGVLGRLGLRSGRQIVFFFFLFVCLIFPFLFLFCN